VTLAADAVKDGLQEKRMHDPRKSAPFLWGREHHPRGSLGPYDGCRSASKRLPGRFSRFARLTGVPETDHGTCDMCTNRPHLRCIRCDVEINYLRCVRTPELCVEGRLFVPSAPTARTTERLTIVPSAVNLMLGSGAWSIADGGCADEWYCAFDLSVRRFALQPAEVA